MPQSPAGYIHRIGRTGRAQNTGASISLVSTNGTHCGYCYFDGYIFLGIVLVLQILNFFVVACFSFISTASFVVCILGRQVVESGV